MASSRQTAPSRLVQLLCGAAAVTAVALAAFVDGAYAAGGPNAVDIGLQAADVPGFTAQPASVMTLNDPNDAGLNQAFIACARSTALLDDFDQGSGAVLSSFYGEGTNPFGTPRLAIASVVFGDGSSAHATAAYAALSGSHFQHCWASTQDSLNAAQGSVIPIGSASVSPLAVPKLADASTGFLISGMYSVGRVSLAAQFGASVIRRAQFVVLVLTVAYDATFPDLVRIPVLNHIAQRLEQIPEPSHQPRPSGAGTPPPASNCPDVAIYGVRGSAQDYLPSQSGMGPEINEMAGQIMDRVPTTMSVLRVGVPYPAVGPAYGALTGDGGGPYNQSVETGAQNLIDGAPGFEGIGHLVQRCPHVHLVIAGISQGAQVITTALAQATQPTPVTDRIAAVLLLASPVRVAGESINIGAEDNSGIFSSAGVQPGQIAETIPTFLDDVTQSYCLDQDPICDFSPYNLIHRQSIHTSYAASIYEFDAAEYAVNHIRGAPDARGGPTVDGSQAWQPAPQNYVAMGDSYSSGEGSNDYFDSTNVTDGDHCHRSPMADTSLLGAQQSGFVACSGATTSDIQNGRYGEPSQLDALSTITDLITVTAGGDDLGFSDVLDNCIDIGWLLHGRSDSDCYGAIDGALQKLPALQSNLAALLTDIHLRAPDAHILLIGYPQLFPPNGYDGGCNGIHTDWQGALNDAGARLDTVLKAVAEQSSDVQYIDTTNAFAGGWVCGRQDGVPDYVNDLQLHCPDNNGTGHALLCAESFHPTLDGYSVLQHLIYNAISVDLLQPQLVLTPDSTLTCTPSTFPELRVRPGTTALQVTVHWPGSIVGATLITPTGSRLTDRHRGEHMTVRTAPTTTTLTVDHPQNGGWRLQLTGIHVRASGEPVHVTIALLTRRGVTTTVPVTALLIAAVGLGVVVLASVLVWPRRRRTT